jgi:hypothetical protein
VICIAAAHRSSNIGEDLQSRRACPRLQRWGAEFDELAVTNIVPALIDPLYNDQTSVQLTGQRIVRLYRQQPQECRRTNFLTWRRDSRLDEPTRESVPSPSRVSSFISELAGQIGRLEGSQFLRGIAGSILDIGQLNVPRTFTEKPVILTVEEMK